MANTPKKLYKNSPTVANQVLYTVPSGKSVIVKNILLCNNTGAIQNVTIHFVTTGETVGNATKYLSNYSVNPNDTVIIELTSVLESLDSIQGSQSIAGAINVFISGLEVA